MLFFKGRLTGNMQMPTDSGNNLQIPELPALSETPSYDFSTLTTKQHQLLDSISQYSAYFEVHKLIRNEIGDTKLKEKLISSNLQLLSVDQVAHYNAAKTIFNQRAPLGSGMIMLGVTGITFLVGLWRLPPHRSIAKFTAIGTAISSLFGYAYWRWEAINYQTVINQQFKLILQSKYKQLMKNPSLTEAQ